MSFTNVAIALEYDKTTLSYTFKQVFTAALFKL